MAIPAYKIVRISPRVVQAGGSDLVLNGLFLTSSELLAAGQMKSFSTAEDVLAFFGDSEEARAAEAYFAGYNNSFRKPEQIFFGGRPTEKTHAVLLGGLYSAGIDALRAFGGENLGALSLTANGVVLSVTGLDLASCADAAAVATAVQTALQTAAGETDAAGITCAYDGTAHCFKITAPSATIGGEPVKTVTVCASSPLADAMKLSAAAHASVSEGVLAGAEFTADDMSNVKVFTTANYGRLQLTVNGTDVDLQNIDLRACRTLEEAASAVQALLETVLPGAACTYYGGRFSISSPGTGEGQTITACESGELAGTMKLTATYATAAAGKSASPCATHAILRGGKMTESASAVLEKLTATGFSADLTVTVDGTPIQMTGIDFSECHTFSQIAGKLQQTMQTTVSGVTCTYNSAAKAFFIKSPTAGEESSIEPCSGYMGSVADILNLRANEGTSADPADGAKAEQGMNAPTVAQTFAALKGVSENWATFTTVYEADKAEAVALAQWASQQGVEYLYICWTTDDTIKDEDKDSDDHSVAHAFLANSVGATGLVYGDLRYAAFVMSIPASIDWDREQGVVTAAFKSQDGLAPVVDNATEADNLISKRCNFYGTYAARNDDFVWLYPGAMYGDYRFLDPFWNLIWFSSAIQTACMNGFKQTPRVPYNEDGYTLIRSWIQDPINRARKSGIIDRGMTLDESQRALFLHESGMNDQALACLINDGYFLLVRDGSPNDRVNRESPEIALWITYAGSVQKIEMPVTLFA